VILYVNGDGHCAAAMAATNFVYAEDDADLWWAGQSPHPSNLSVSFGSYVSKALKARYVVEAKAHNTAQDIISQTTAFLSTVMSTHEQVVVIIGTPKADMDLFKAFAAELKERKVKHLVYPTEDYQNWLTTTGHTANSQGYFNGDAHRSWAGNLMKPLTQLL